MPPKDIEIGRRNGRLFVYTEEGYQPLPHIYEVEEELEEEEEPWPKVNPHIKRAVDAFCEVAPQIVQAIVEVLPVIIEATADVLKTYPNHRVTHLALHGKPRTRKKNWKRILRYYKKMRKD